MTTINQIPIDARRVNVAANDNATHLVAGAERLSAGNRAALLDYCRKPRGRRDPAWKGAQFTLA